MNWKSNNIPAWGCFAVAILTLASMWIIRALDSKSGAPVDSHFLLTVFASLIVAASIVAGGILNYKASTSPKNSTATTEPAHPKVPIRSTGLTIRIMEGYFGVQRNDTRTGLLLLKVKVDGIPTTLEGWELDLQLYGDHWLTGWQLPMISKDKAAPVRFEEDSCATELRKCQMMLDALNDLNPFNVKPEPIPFVDGENAKLSSPVLGTLVPESGWLLFRVPGAGLGTRFGDLVFGATFVLTAIEASKAKSPGRQVAGEWLHRALIDYPWRADEKPLKAEP